MTDLAMPWPHDKGADKPKNKWVAITPSDDDALDPIPCAIACSSSVGGHFTIEGEDGNAEQFYTQPGQYHPLRPRKLYATALGENLTFNGLYD